MATISRRGFLHGSASTLALLGVDGVALGATAPFGSVDKFDLVVKGGELVDPSRALRGKRDIGIRNAVIAAVEAEIPAERAKQVLDVGGKLVFPGLVDLHAHVYHQGSALGLPADELVPYSGTTTYVSAGDAGHNSFSAFKHYIIEAALCAKQRGVVIDVGHGGGSFDYTVAEPAIQQGLAPDTISSDVHAVSVNMPGMPFLPWVMSKFLNLGFTLEQVVAMATINPAKIIGRVEKLGTLQLGAPADISVMELIEGPVAFVDTRANARQGQRYLKPFQTVRAGRPFGRPYPTPFAYP